MRSTSREALKLTASTYSFSRSYPLLISLAVTDLLVRIFAVPFYIKAFVSPGCAWSLISMLADVSTGITSIYTLAVISLEIIYAVGWPVRHRIVNYRVYVCAISIPWISGNIYYCIGVTDAWYNRGGGLLVLSCFNSWNPSDNYMCS